METVAEASLAGKVELARPSGPKIQTPQSCPTHRNDVGIGARGERGSYLGTCKQFTVDEAYLPRAAAHVC